jgi:hypothetical protein
MIRCIELRIGADQKSHFGEGLIDLEPSYRVFRGKVATTAGHY